MCKVQGDSELKRSLKQAIFLNLASNNLWACRSDSSLEKGEEDEEETALGRIAEIGRSPGAFLQLSLLFVKIWNWSDLVKGYCTRCLQLSQCECRLVLHSCVFFSCGRWHDLGTGVHHFHVWGHVFSLSIHVRTSRSKRVPVYSNSKGWFGEAVSRKSWPPWSLHTPGMEICGCRAVTSPQLLNVESFFHLEAFNFESASGLVFLPLLCSSWKRKKRMPICAYNYICIELYRYYIYTDSDCFASSRKCQSFTALSHLATRNCSHRVEANLTCITMTMQH